MAPKKTIIIDSSADELKQTKPKAKSKKVIEPEPTTQNSDSEKESVAVIEEPKPIKKVVKPKTTKTKAIKSESESEPTVSAIVEVAEPTKPKGKSRAKVIKTDSEQEQAPVVAPKTKAATKSKKTKNDTECELFTESVASAVKQLEELKSDSISSKPDDIEKELEISKSKWLEIQNKIDTINLQVESIEREKDEVLKHLTDLLDLLKEETEPSSKTFSLDKKINVNDTKSDKNIIPMTNSDSSSDPCSESSSDSSSDSEIQSKILAPKKGKKTAAKGKAVIKKKVAISDSDGSESE